MIHGEDNTTKNRLLNIGMVQHNCDARRRLYNIHYTLFVLVAVTILKYLSLIKKYVDNI